jgi:hypothetical protein
MQDERDIPQQKTLRLDAVKVQFVDPATKKPTKMDLFADAKRIQQQYGKDVHGAAVAQALDLYEGQMKRGVVYYDTRHRDRAVILHDRASLLDAFYSDHQIGRIARGG